MSGEEVFALNSAGNGRMSRFHASVDPLSIRRHYLKEGNNVENGS